MKKMNHCIEQIQQAERAYLEACYEQYSLFEAGSWLHKPVGTVREALKHFAKYEGVEVLDLGISTEKAHLDKYGSFTGMMFPYVKFGEDMYVSKSALLNWIKEVTTNRREYGSGGGYKERKVYHEASVTVGDGPDYYSYRLRE